MASPGDRYAQYVAHPRYGRRPNLTGLNPSPYAAGVCLHWIAVTHREVVRRYESIIGKKWPYGDFSDYFRDVRRIANTAILADVARQTAATLPVTHYFDVERPCRDCGRFFIFFAEEQRHWYEELGFSLESDCVRCVECRKRQQGIARRRERYELLFHIPHRTARQSLEMAAACLALIEADVFTRKRIETVRMLLNEISDDADVQTQRAALLKRVNSAGDATLRGCDNGGSNEAGGSS